MIHDNRITKDWIEYAIEFAELQGVDDDTAYNTDVLDLIAEGKIDTPREMKKQCFLCNPGYVYSIRSRRCVLNHGGYDDWTVAHSEHFTVKREYLDRVLAGCAHVALDPEDYALLPSLDAFLKAVHCHECIPTLTKAVKWENDQWVF